MTADELTAYSAATTTIVTLLLLLMARGQIRLVQYENRKAATLAACTHYDLSENMYAATTDLWKARQNGQLERDPKKFKPQISLVLNHLDAIAIGINQGIYIENLAWDHLHAIVANHVKNYVDTGLCERADLLKENYRTLIDLRNKWSRARPRFHDGGWWKRFSGD